MLFYIEFEFNTININSAYSKPFTIKHLLKNSFLKEQKDRALNKNNTISTNEIPLTEQPIQKIIITKKKPRKLRGFQTIFRIL